MPLSAVGREDSYMAVYTYDSPDRFVAGTVGEPGQRTFYLQASASGRVTSVVVEKFQVSLLAERIEELLDELLRSTGGQGSVPAAAPAALTDDGPLDLPLTEDFRVGAIALGWDGEDEQVVIEVPEDGPAVLRVRLSPAAARAFSKRAIQIVGQGRPPCPLCGLPLDAEGHICPRQNGHRV